MLAIPFDNTYVTLPERFYARIDPTPVRKAELIAVNDELAVHLGLDPAALRTDAGIAAFAGNAVPEGAAPLAQAYAGHQFGAFVPQLGDGRALLLGEVVDRGGVRRDIQLKGSGRTPFSRTGDGRAWVGPVLREYIVSEAMHALGIPTTRALAAVATGEPVYRESPLPGAVLTRVASSHLRVGTFEYFAARQDVDALRLLTEHAIARHYPEAGTPFELFDAVVERQARLVSQWMAVGFIHGVMNTDNTSIAGETIDYGPCAFMDAYHPERVFSFIDRMGRYAYDKQPSIALWNMARFARCLMPLVGPTERHAERMQASLERGAHLLSDAWLAAFRAKLGLETAEEGDAALIHGLLDAMATGGADFTNTFRALGRNAGEAAEAAEAAEAELRTSATFRAWASAYEARLARETTDAATRRKRMDAANPAYIPRNHRVEQVIAAAVGGDYGPFLEMVTVLKHPFVDQPEHAAYARAPEPHEAVTRTFCGT